MYNTRTENLDALLSIICEELQLPTSEYDRAEEHYVAVGHWLDAEGSLLRSWKPVIYPQGSFRIGTTVKPLKEDEFDLDLVCELQLGEANIAPLSVLDMVERRLRDHGTYHNMIERKRRCVRLTYAHEFHLDILPARPDGQASGTRVRIPDGDLSMWLPSDPRGYARWFEGQAERIKLARVEPVPDQESVAEKSSLQRAVQLLKRWRDLAYQDNTDVAPRSIVLTTLAGECVVEATSTSAALREIIDGITIRV
ncbi:MAG: nucleotidyltransferase, partial [Candidatus Krumholzibacteria bacterium]|nr:nucleotidyltransferase [Candidatus Krumholzibacteria bacterium]